MTIAYRVETKMEEIDDAISQVIEIIGSTLARQESLKDFANKLFTEPELVETDEAPVTVETEEFVEDDTEPVLDEEDQGDAAPEIEE